jgi:hypothetical protein
MGRMPERCLRCGSDKGPPSTDPNGFDSYYHTISLPPSHLIFRYLIFSRDITHPFPSSLPQNTLTAEGHL